MTERTTCDRCGSPVTYSGRGRPSRFCSTACRSANKVASDKARYDRERERILEKKREYYERNREQISAKDAKYRAEHRDRLRDGMREWRERNLEKVRADDRRRHVAHRDEDLEWMRSRRRRLQARTAVEADADAKAAHPDGTKMCRAGHDSPLTDFYRDKSRTDGLALYCKSHYAPNRRALLDEGWDCSRCFYCGDPISSFHIDHVVPVALGGADDSRNLAPACAPCNLSKNDTPVAIWYRRKFGRPFNSASHPHAGWLSGRYPEAYPSR